MTITKIPPEMMQGGPAFSAKLSANQTGYTTGTLINFDAEDFDTANCYDLTTRRFTPNVAGYYAIFASVYLRGAATPVTYASLGLRKNGSSIASGPSAAVFSTSEALASISELVYMNGTTDYLDLILNFGGGASQYLNSNSAFKGFLARPA